MDSFYSLSSCGARHFTVLSDLVFIRQGLLIVMTVPTGGLNGCSQLVRVRLDTARLLALKSESGEGT